MATQIPALPAFDPWPERKLPQPTFDARVRTSMNQASTFVVTMNGEVIPALNQLAREVEGNAAAGASSAANAKASETAAKASETAARTSENNAKASETATANALAKANTDMAAKLAEAASHADRAGESAREAKASADELYGLEIVVDESPTHTGAAVLDRDKKLLTISIPPGKDGESGPPGPAGQITSTVEANFFQFVIEDSNLVLNWAGAEPAMDFAINANGELEVAING